MLKVEMFPSPRVLLAMAAGFLVHFYGTSGEFVTNKSQPSATCLSGNNPPPAAGLLVRRIGLFDATMVVIGGIVGAGIFMNPAVVAKQLHSPALILGAWVFGGIISLLGAFIYAELSSVRPHVGGQYAYFREAFHPIVGFVYGWCLLLVSQSGGMAAVAVTFAQYYCQLTGFAGPPWRVALTALAVLTIVNCLGVRTGTTVQTVLTVLKVVTIVALVTIGWILVKPYGESAGEGIAVSPGDLGPFRQFGSAMVPVLFAYGGWQTACFVGGEVYNPQRNLPRALLWGIFGVIILYLSVSVVCLRAFGPAGLAATSTPASDLMRKALGETGGRLIAAGIVISTFGFLAQGMLTAPRVYFAMARDGMFFNVFGQVHPTTGAPVAAIALQGLVAMIIAVSGRYDQILNYVVSVDFIFYGLTACCVFLFRSGEVAPSGFRIPGHPWTTLFFVLSCWAVVANLLFGHGQDSLIGLGILLAGVPVYFLRKALSRSAPSK